jgi:tight adherence protein C
VIESDLWRYATFSDFIALSGIVAVIAGGATLIVASMPTRGETLAQRVIFAVPRAAARSSAAAKVRGPQPSTVLQKLPSISGGLSEPEHRQVIGLFSHFGASADRAVPYFVVTRVVLAAALGVLTLAAGLRFGFTAAHWWLPVVAAMASAIAGWILPIFIISHLVKKRIKAVVSGLPNALDLLVVCVEAGLSLEDGLQRVARELRESQPALAEELALTWAEASILPDRTQALVNLSDRIDNPSLRAVVGMMSQSLRFGTPLGQSLRVGAAEMRNDQMTKLEERASRLPALMTIPVMLFIMPTIFLIVGGPAALRIMDIFTGGTH